MTPSVTYTGNEVALLAALIAAGLPALNENDFDVADLLLERALAAIPPLSPDVAARIAALRERPHTRMEDTHR